MSEIIGESWRRPIQAPVDAAVADVYFEGALLKAGASDSNLQVITAKGDTVLAVLDEPVTNARTGESRAAKASERLAVWRLGCGATVKVACITAQAFTPGAVVYADDGTNGMATAVSGSSASRPIGHYPYFGFKSRTTAAAGELIPVVLDIDPGAALV